MIIILMCFIGIQTGKAQETSAKRTETIIIQTSAQCDDCKERIENALNYTKGVSFAELDLETKKVTVKYKTGLITPEQIKQKIAEIGYDADDVKAEKAGFDKLPTCCKPGGHK